MKIILAPMGSEGDIRPMIALGLGLRAAGHRVCACLPPDLCPEFAHYGLDLRPGGIRVKDFFRDNAAVMMGHGFKTFKPMIREFARVVNGQFDDLSSVIKDADLLINAGLQFAGSSVAEHAGIPFFHAVHVPQLIPSRFYPPAGTPWMGLPPIVNMLIWAMYNIVMDRLLKKTIDVRRRGLGLEPISGISSFYSRSLVLAMDPELGPLPADAPAGRFSQTGYWQLDTGEDIDAEVRRFLDAGPPPVYIGFGSMSDPRPRETFACLRRAVDSLGIRALVKRGWAGLAGDATESGRIRFFDRAPHVKLFPRMAVVVHHGGAGTTHSAGLSGVPQVVVPHFLDQYWWGHRIAAIGLGPRPLHRSKLTSGNLARAIGDALDNATYRGNAATLAAALRARDGIAEMVAKVEGKG